MNAYSTISVTSQHYIKRVLKVVDTFYGDWEEISIFAVEATSGTVV